MTHEQFITLETARLAKQAGFDWEVYSCYYKSSPDRVSTNGTLTSNFNGYAFQHIAISAPTQSVLQKWLREVKEIIVEPIYDLYDHCFYCRFANNKSKNWQYIVNRYDDGEVYIKLCFNTYESTLEAGLQKCLTLII